MSNDFETKVEAHALDYIRILLREGYYVNAFVDKGKYRIHAYKKEDAVIESKWQIEGSE